MKDRLGQLASELLNTGVGDLTRHECCVLEKIAARAHVSQNVNKSYDDQLTVGKRMADSVARVGGSCSFVTGFCLFLVFWTIVNSLLLRARGCTSIPIPIFS